MADYIVPPIETDAETLADGVFAVIEALIPGWEPSDAHLETILTRQLTAQIAEARDVATLVGTEIFRILGEQIAGVTAKNPTYATAQTTWSLTDTAGHTIPAGTVVQVQSSDTQVAFEVVSQVIVLGGSDTATNVEIRAVAAGAAGSGLSGTVTLVDGLAFVDAITLDAATSGGDDGETDDEYLARLREELTLLAPRPILPADFEVLARRTDGVHRAIAIDGYNPDHNRLTANQSSVETDTTGFQADTNAAIARTTATAADGVASLRITSSAAGASAARTLSGTSGIAVVAGAKYTALASFRPAAARDCHVDIIWYTAGGAVISTTAGATANVAAGAYTALAVTAVAPATAAFAAVRPVFTATAGAETCDVDRWALHEGDSLTWTLGPSTGTGTARYLSVAAVDELGQPVGTAVRAALQDNLDAMREVTFAVRAIDATITPVAVTFTAVAYKGYDTADVQSRAVAAVSEYLNPATWGRANAGDTFSWVADNIVRYLEVATAINNVEGLHYISALTVNGGAVDVTLPGVVALPTAGVITATITAP